MEYYYSTYIFLSCISLLFVLKLVFSNNDNGNRKKTRLPPGPKPLPIIGNILQLTDKPHRALAELAKAHGPLIHLKLGHIPTLVISSPSIAKDLFLNHDLSFSNRKVPDTARAHNHDTFSMVWLPVSPKWRNLRKISAVQLFTAKRLDATRHLRQTKARELANYARECSQSGEAVNIGCVGFTTSLNLHSNTFLSVDLAESYRSTASKEFKEIVWWIMEYLGKPNLSDFFPWMSWFDPLGVRRSMEIYFSKMFEVFDEMINQRLTDSVVKDDVLQTLLEISKQEGSDFGLVDIKHFLLDLFPAGTDTTSSTLEWAMTELLRNPSKMAKAQAELNETLGKDALEVQESDIERLPYLQAIVKETLRLHPPAPLLVPHKTREDVDFCGYTIPKDTQVFVNVWAIGRDPNVWMDPCDFLPERFMERDIDIIGGSRNFELIPFGAGRRICPGLSLGYRMVHLMLATLLHGFRWRLEDGVREEDVDMSEKFGITMIKAKPLLAIPMAK